MTAVELPTLAINAVATIVATSRPLLANRDPGPDEVDVPLGSTIAVEVIDPGVDGVARAATRVWVNDELAFDGSVATPIASMFAGARAQIGAAADTLRIVLDPIVPFASQATVRVRVVATIVGAASAIDETYAFIAEDRTAPQLVAAIATSACALRLGFDKPVMVADATTMTIEPLDAPAVPVVVVGATATDALINVVVTTEMTPDARYRIRAVGVTDTHGNLITPPFDAIAFTGFRAQRPATRRFDLWSMLSKHNRRSDVTGDLARFIACLQELLDLQLTDIDRFVDIFDLERAPETFVDLILRDLGNPFTFDLDVLGKRRLASILVEMYGQKGTAVGIRNAIRFFLGVDVVAITALAATALVLGESELGVDWELGPSARFARYAFDLQVSRVLDDRERRQLREIVNFLRPAHTHFIHLLEPLPAITPDRWELGVSELSVDTVLS